MSAPALLDPEVDEHIDQLHAGISARQRDLLRLVARADRAGRWQDDGCRDMAQWLCGRLGISNWTARRWVSAAHALEQLPHISDALETGFLSLDKVVELTRFATPESEAQLIKWARRVSPAAIRRKADIANRPSLEETREADDARFLRWWWFDDGKRLGLEAEFGAAQGAAITKALRRVAETLPELPQDPTSPGLGHDSFEQRCADALEHLSRAAVATDADPEMATVVVHTTLGACHVDEDSAVIEDGPVIHPEVARRLSCDARLQFVLHDRAGNALGIGRASRDVPRWVRRQLRHRDNGCCTFPGCEMRGYLQAHHIIHWEDGGLTDYYNLVLVCSFHHKLVHELGWDVRLKASVAQWFRPGGRRYDPGPDPPQRLALDLASNDFGLVDERRAAVAV